jgi:hypothetical protein
MEPMSRFLGLMILVLLLGAGASPLSAQVKTKAAGHDLAGKENCMMCHAVGVMEPVPDVPASHEGRANETCVWCHAPDAPMVTTGAKQFSHDPAGKENCMMCHAAGVMEPVPDVPANHEGRANATCTWCHTHAGNMPPG